jgi:succinate dehydrogenase/fumarate reductase flavoprotein subunit
MKPIVKTGQPPTDSLHTPVAIVGGGACGLVAALTLHHYGIESIVIERDALSHGSTALSSGFIPAPCTLAQTRQGITDSVDDFAHDIQRKAKDTAAAQLVASYANAIGPAMNFLEQHYDMQWQVLDSFLYPGHSQYRMHTVPLKQSHRRCANYCTEQCHCYHALACRIENNRHKLYSPRRHRRSFTLRRTVTGL